MFCVKLSSLFNYFSTETKKTFKNISKVQINWKMEDVIQFQFSYKKNGIKYLKFALKTV